MKKNWNLWRFYSLLKYKIKKHENDKVILEVEIEKSEVKTELIQFKNRSGQALNTMNVKKEEI